MKKRRLNCTLFIFIATIILSGCKKDSGITPTPTAADINFTIEGDKDLEQTIYPSLLIGLSNLSSKLNVDFFTFKVKNPIANSQLKIKIESSNINDETIFQTQMANINIVYSYSPLIKWNYTNLKQLKQSGSINLTFVCYINDNEIDRKNIRYSYRSVNECVYGYTDANGNYKDTKWMFAAFVNEDNPKIDILLQDVLSDGIVNSFSGYQAGKTGVINQLFAIWYYLQSKGMKYSSITNTSNPSNKVFSQYVRFFDEVYNNDQANCADGSVFLASILKKIGIKPSLVIIPGHMYLGFYTAADKSKGQLLETTMVGAVDLREIYVDGQYVYGLTKYRTYISDNTYNAYFNHQVSLDYVKTEISWNSYVSAVNQNINSFNSNLSKFNDPNNHEYKTFDIDALRQVIQPIAKIKALTLKPKI